MSEELETTEHPYTTGRESVEAGQQVEIDGGGYRYQAAFVGWFDMQTIAIDQGRGPEKLPQSHHILWPVVQPGDVITVRHGALPPGVTGVRWIDSNYTECASIVEHHHSSGRAEVIMDHPGICDQHYEMLAPASEEVECGMVSD